MFVLLLTMYPKCVLVKTKDSVHVASCKKVWTKPSHFSWDALGEVWKVWTCSITPLSTANIYYFSRYSMRLCVPCGWTIMRHFQDECEIFPKPRPSLFPGGGYGDDEEGECVNEDSDDGDQPSTSNRVIMEMGICLGSHFIGGGRRPCQTLVR